MGVIKHQQKLVYDLYEYLKQQKWKKTKVSMLIGRNPFPNKNNTLNNVNIARKSILKWLSVI